jgi:hypothetical protein
VPPLANTAETPSALAGAVLDALQHRDVNRLHALSLDEREFREHVWPDLPAARPDRNLPISYVWGDLRQKSESSLGRVVAAKGGQPLELVSLRFAGGTTAYKSYAVHRQAVMVVKDGTGAQTEFRAFGSVLEKDGQFKVFSYVVD